MMSQGVPRCKGDTLQSVARALAVLDLLGAHPEGLLAKRISRELKLNISTCYHLVNTLLAAGYIERDAETLLIRLGPKITWLTESLPAGDAPHATWQSGQQAMTFAFASGRF